MNQKIKKIYNEKQRQNPNKNLKDLAAITEANSLLLKAFKIVTCKNAAFKKKCEEKRPTKNFCPTSKNIQPMRKKNQAMRKYF